MKQSKVCKEGYPEEVPTCTTSCRIDFWRLEPGVVTSPAVADDIKMMTVDWSEAKVFSSPQEMDALLWARWGASKFAWGQWRSWTTNPYDEEYEKKITQTWTIDGDTWISYNALVAMLAPNFPRKKESDPVSLPDADFGQSYMECCLGWRFALAVCSLVQSFAHAS